MGFHVVWSDFDLKINLDKSKLIPLGKVSNFEDLLRVLGCKVGFLLSSYLSLPF